MYDCVDLFAGSGWGVALARLGLFEQGVEIMPEAVATRRAAGMDTLAVSVAELPDSFCSRSWLKIASPPCQTFSISGKGDGRKALEEVLRRLDALVRTGGLNRSGGDARTWLVLEPLRLALGALPDVLIWEQVPTVLPVWEACAVVLRAHGYSVVTGNVQAEMYGVPQTRKRAFLLARRDGVPAAFPVATHSRYHSRDPRRLDAGVKPWVSMAEALSYGLSERPSFTLTGGGSDTGGAEPFGNRARQGIRAAIEDGRWVQRSNYAGPQTAPGQTAEERGRTTRGLDEPSVTLTSKGFQWTYERPATTVQGDARIWPPGHKVNADDRRRHADADERYGDRAGSAAIRVTPEEAAVLQTFPRDHPFQGSKGKRYLQIGNAVPPLLAEAFVASVL